MAIQSSTFSKREIGEFLRNTNNAYAASCWNSDIKSETPTWLETSNWFQRWFTDSNVGQYTFRLAELVCTQYWEMEENA
jgi:hypothetical protein